MNWYKKLKENMLVSLLIKVAIKLSSLVKKISKDDLDEIYNKVLSLKDSDLQGYEKAAEAAQWAAEKFFGGETGHTVRTVIQIAYTIAKIKKDII